MDINFVNENGRGGVTMQHYELKHLVNYALKWAEISNNSSQNKEVRILAEMIESKIEDWISELPK